MEIVTYFGPPLVKATADTGLLKKLNDYADRLIEKDLQGRPELSLPVPGIFHRIYPLRKGFMDDVDKLVIQLGTDFLKKISTSKSSEKAVSIREMLVICQRQGSWKNIHHHTGAISGIIYLKMPEDLNSGIPAEMRDLYPGAVSFTAGTSGPFSQSQVTITPTPGEVYLFPSNMNHTVYPFFGEGERRCLAFNLDVI